MNENPFISVVIPAHNAERTISQAIQSVLGQTFRNLELVICDDASTDATYRIASSFKDPRIKILRNKQNLGAGLSRDLAIENSRGNWIAFLDADDAWHTDRLRRMIAAMNGEQTAIVFDDIMICHHLDYEAQLCPWRPIHGQRAFGSKKGEVVTLSLETYIQSDRLLIKPLIPAASIHEKKIRHSQRTFGEDAEFFIRLGLAGLRFKYLPEPLYLYRMTPGSATIRSNTNQMAEMLDRVLSGDSAPEIIKIAIERKISKLHSEEYVHLATKRASKGELLDATIMVLSRPYHFFSCWRKIVKGLLYRISRWRITRIKNNDIR